MIFNKYYAVCWQTRTANYNDLFFSGWWMDNLDIMDLLPQGLWHQTE